MCAAGLARLGAVGGRALVHLAGACVGALRPFHQRLGWCATSVATANRPDARPPTAPSSVASRRAEKSPSERLANQQCPHRGVARCAIAAPIRGCHRGCERAKSLMKRCWQTRAAAREQREERALPHTPDARQTPATQRAPTSLVNEKSAEKDLTPPAPPQPAQAPAGCAAPPTARGRRWSAAPAAPPPGR